MVKRKSEEVKVKPRTKRARRILERREPKLVGLRCTLMSAFSWDALPLLLKKASSLIATEFLGSFHLTQVEDLKSTLLLHGPRTSQITKDVLADIHKLRSVRFLLPSLSLAVSVRLSLSIFLVKDVACTQIACYCFLLHASMSRLNSHNIEVQNALRLGIMQNCLVQREAVKLSRKNDNIRPFEAGGEVELEHLARRADTGGHPCLHFEAI